MFSKQIFTALVAAAGVVSAASSSSDDCTATSFKISAQADFDKIADCETITGNVVLDSSTSATLDLSGPKKIDGDLTLLNNAVVVSLQSTSLATITGALHLQNLTALSTLSFASLSQVETITWITLTALSELVFTTGVDKATTVEISDTFLSSLTGLDVSSASTININNNRQLVSWSSSLGNLSTLLNINANGQDLVVSFPNLIWAANMTISNVSSFSAPSLATVNGSMRFDSNTFANFSAPNLTATASGDISFVSNSELTNITMPKLKSVGGGFQIANNTALEAIDGFPALANVGGAIKLRGNFTEVDLPSLKDVKGAFDLESTADVTDSCTTLKKLAPSSAGGNGDIQGSFTCKGDVANANSDTSTGTSTSSSSSASSTAGSGAADLNINSMVVLAMAGVAGLAQLL